MAGLTHFIAVFAIFTYDHAVGYRQVLLGLPPVKRDKRWEPRKRCLSVFCALEVCAKAFNGLVAIIGDNKNVYKMTVQHATKSFLVVLIIALRFLQRFFRDLPSLYL